MHSRVGGKSIVEGWIGSREGDGRKGEWRRNSGEDTVRKQ